MSVEQPKTPPPESHVVGLTDEAVFALAEVMLGMVNAPENVIYRAARRGLEAALAATPERQVVVIHPDDFQLLDRLDRDNVAGGARPVIESEGWDQARRLSDDGLLAIESVGLGGRLHITRKGMKAVAAFKRGGTTPERHVRGSDLTNEQKEITLLRIIDAMGGRTDSSDYPGNWLTWFCSDEIHNVREDTFNRCNDKGWLHTAHDSDTDTSTTTLTKAGRAALSSEGPAE